MWCAACRADVAAELSSDNRRMLCARCHSELGTAAGGLDRPATGPRLQDTERNARELLARWSTQHVLESPMAATTSASPAVTPTSELSPGRIAHRLDGAHSSVAAPMVNVPANESSEEKRPERPRRRKKLQRPRLAEISRDDASPKPNHDDLVRQAVQQPVARSANWTTSIGQLCAYGGVAVLTLGTVMVLSGYFGGPAHYAPTGWLVAAVGQMLLFLGVVTLVSGGMEQTVDEVSWRIDHLASTINRLEQVIDAQQTQLKEFQRRELRRSRRDQSDAA